SLAKVVPLPLSNNPSRRSLAHVVRGRGSGGVKPVLQSALTTGKRIGVSLGAVHVRLTGSVEIVPARKNALPVKLPSHRFPPEYEPSRGLGLTETTQFHQLAVSNRSPCRAESLFCVADSVCADA